MSNIWGMPELSGDEAPKLSVAASYSQALAEVTPQAIGHIKAGDNDSPARSMAIAAVSRSIVQKAQATAQLRLESQMADHSHLAVSARQDALNAALKRLSDNVG